MMKVGIGTTNKAKVSAVLSVVTKHFHDILTFEHISVDSGVSAQPMSTEETRTGAINRARRALVETNATIAFGLEGGVTMIDDIMYLCNWGALAIENGQLFTAAGAQIPLPDEIAEQIAAGRELGPVMDDFVHQSDTHQNAGAIGILTDGMLDRKEMFEHILQQLVGQYFFYPALTGSKTPSQD
jgi:inosine/xanthosine triphosphatase